MKKAMLLGTVLLTMLFGATGCGNETKDEVKSLTNEQVVATYLNVEDGILADRIEVNDYNDKIHGIDEDYVQYTAYDEDGDLIACGGVDISWATHTYCK